MKPTKKPTPVHPGEILLEEFLQPMGISQYALAKAIAAPPRRINEIVHGNRAITADTDLRLCKFFGLTEGYWLRAFIYLLRRSYKQMSENLMRLTFLAAGVVGAGHAREQKTITGMARSYMVSIVPSAETLSSSNAPALIRSTRS
jgi:antitoxin HigA-1